MDVVGCSRYFVQQAVGMDLHPSSIEGFVGMCAVFSDEMECSASSIVTDDARGASSSLQRSLISSVRIISVEVFPFFCVITRPRPIRAWVTFYFNVQRTT